MFTHVAVIPFGLIETGQSLEKSMAMQKEMKPILNNIVKSVDKVLEWQRKTQNKVNLFYSNLMYVLYAIADNQVSHCSLVFSTYMNLGRNIFSTI